MNTGTRPYTTQKELTKYVWTLGDYDEIAKLTWGAAPQLLSACGVAAGHELLEVGAGNGNFALLAADRGARVTASDLRPAQASPGRARTEPAGAEIEWSVADAAQLPFEDSRFDR